MTRPARRLRAAALTSAALVAAHAIALAVLPDRGQQVAGEVVLVLVTALGSWWAFGVARRREVSRPHVGVLLGLGFATWCGAGILWAWYEGVLREPVPAAYDLVYTAGGLVLLAAVASRLLPLLDRTAAVRAVLDGLLVGSSLFFTAWVLLGDELGRDITTWRYPAVDLVAATLSFLVVTRVPQRSRSMWWLIVGGFLVLTLADCSWAWGDIHGAYALGNPADVLWPLGYALVALGPLLTSVRQEQGIVHDGVRVTPARWEVVLPYGPVAVAFGVAFYEHLFRDGFRGELVTGGLLLVVLLIARHVVAVLENHNLTRSLEVRVGERTAELQASEAHFRSVIQGISDLVLVLDADRRITYHTPAAGPMLGFHDGELLGRHAPDLVHTDDLAGLAPTRAAVREVAGATASSEVRLQRADGSWVPIELTLTNMLDHPAVRGIVVTVRDITERKELEDRLRHQAYHDHLTGLANRSRLNGSLDQLVAAGRQPALVLLDLDEFKALNDTAGHELGDEVLVAVAERLLRCTRPGDVVARLGGDEFAVLIDDDPDGDTSLVVAGRVLAALTRTVSVRGREIRCGASVGVARVRVGGDATQVLRDADVAMYVAKANGKHRVEVFSEEMHEHVVRRGRLEERVRAAVADGDLVLHYQPLVDLADGTVVGVEALVRLPDGEGGLVPPMEFVPIAEETGLIVPMGSWVLRTACRQAAEWQSLRPDGPPIQVSVNLSVRQLQAPGLADQVAAALDEAALPAGLLTLEITEGALAADAGVESTLRCLRALGVRLSIDDFGAGYSSLGRLRDFPVDELKIDRSFVREISGPDAPAPIVGAVLSMAASLGLDVVAEGIEQPVQAAHLATRGCRVGQGFLFARPLPADALAGLLRPKLTTKGSSPLPELL